MPRLIHVQVQAIEASNPRMTLLRLTDQDDSLASDEAAAEFFATDDDLRAIIRACQGVLHTPEATK